MICEDSLPLVLELPFVTISSQCSRPDTIEEMDASLLENSCIDTQVDDIVTEEQITTSVPLPPEVLHQQINNNTYRLFFTSYRGTNNKDHGGILFKSILQIVTTL